MAKKHGSAPHNPPPQAPTEPAPTPAPAETSGFKLPDPDKPAPPQPVAPPAAQAAPVDAATANPPPTSAPSPQPPTPIAATPPAPSPQPSAPVSPPAPQPSPTATVQVPSPTNAAVPPIVQTDTSTRDLAIAGGVLLALSIVFLFLKNAHANRLVAHRIPPRRANTAGWWLFLTLLSVATATVFGIAAPGSFLTPSYLLPVGGIALLGLVLTFLTSRR